MTDGQDLKPAAVENSSASTLTEKDSSKDAGITLIAKWGKERITLSSLSPDTTIEDVNSLITDRTGVLPKRQKLIGLKPKSGPLTDDSTLSTLKMKKNNEHSFILMGTAEKDIFVDPSERDDLPDVIDDFELDFSAGSEMWVQHVANGQNLKKFTDSTAIHIMNAPREGKPLMVLDLDHTLLDFSSKTLQQQPQQLLNNGTDAAAQRMKRPFMDEFLTSAYRHYDLVVWSQTSWRWLETKLIELGMLTHVGYKFCFVLDKTSMFAIKSTKRDGTIYQHHVKPLQIIWTKFAERWGSHNTVHLDDLSRNFALNLSSGLKVTAYYRKKSAGRRDVELVGLGRYLEQLALSGTNFDDVDFGQWMDVVSGKVPLAKNSKTDSNQK